MKNKGSVKKIIMDCILSWIFATGILFYMDRVKVSEAGNGLMEQFSLLRLYQVKGFYLLFVLMALAWILLDRYGDSILPKVYQYRYLLCTAVFLVCVFFEVNGSSIGMWNSDYFLGGTDSGLLAGASRMARSDEWFVSTPMALSQYHNPGGAFAYFSEIVRGTSTDVFLEYGQPVKDIAEIFRPFHWGYLLFSAGRGLAFFWCGRFLALFLVSFEMGMLITEKNKGLSLAYAMLLALSPVVQWWFAVNGLVEMILYAQLSILAFRTFLLTDRTLFRALLAAVVFICAGGFILTLYPAWMMPIALVLLGLIIWQFLENLRYCRLKKRDVLILVLEALVFLAILAHVYLNSRDTIDALFNTVYPGSRFETGGGEGGNLTNYVSEFWYPMLGIGTMVNASESAQFIDFFPICYILPVYCMIREKKADRLTVILLIISGFLCIYMVTGVPGWLAGISLMSFSTAHRTLQVAGFCNLLLLFRSLTLMKKKPHPAVSASVAVILAGLCVWQNLQRFGEFYQGRTAIAILSAAAVAACFFLILQGTGGKAQKMLLLLIAVLSLAAGGLANPIRLSVKNVTENKNIVEMQRVVASDPTAVWAIEGLGVPMTNVGLIAGAPSINSTNIYPALERWQTLDNGENEEIYNRYAHILVNLQPEGEPSFRLYGPDYFQVDLTLDDLKMLGVTYILTGKDLAAFPEEEQRKVNLVHAWDAFRVYKLQ